MRKYIHLLLTALFVIGFLGSAYSRENPADTSDEIFPYAQDDEDMKLFTPGKSFTTRGIQYGGWITPVILDMRPDPDNTLTTSVNTARLWVKSYLWKNSFLYIRGKEVYTRFLSKKGDYEQSIPDDYDNLVDLDMGFISMRSSGGMLSGSLGRKLYTLGTGLILNGRGDGGEVNFFSRYANVKLLGMYTGLLRKDNNPYGLSSKDFSDGSKRIFAGGEVILNIINQSIYIMGLAQMDRGDEATGTKTRYQSQYYGGGVKGVFLEGLSYQGEFIYEMGKSYLTGAVSDSEKENIKAYAGIFNLNYFFKLPLNPAIIAQYAYGSGDSDKTANSGSWGNVAGDDNGFQAFGTYVGGFALRPVLANIHVIRGGFAFAPFSWSSKRYVRKMSLIVKYSYYMKDKSEGIINGGEAQENSRNIGQGGDLSLRWSIFSDLSFFMNYAVFLPGDAYTSSEGNDRRAFAMAGLNLSF